MVRHMDTEMTVMKEDVFIPSSLETGGMARHAGPQREAAGSVGMQEEQGEKHGPEPLLWFLKERQGKAG